MAFDDRTMLEGASVPALKETYSGKVFYVGTTSSTTGVSASDSNAGILPQYPLSTLGQAITNCRSGRGDVIYIESGYTATLGTGAAAMLLNKNNVSIVGLGSGDQRPTLTWGAAVASSFDIGTSGTATDGCLIENMVFKATAGAFAHTAMMNVLGSTTIRNCDFYLINGGTGATLGILTNANASRTVIDGCRFIGATTYATGTAAQHTNAIKIVGGASLQIVNTDIVGRFSTTLGCIQVVTTASTNLRVVNVNMANFSTGATKTLVDTQGSSTGFIDKTTSFVLSGTAPFTLTTSPIALGPSNYAAAGVNSLMVAITPA